MNIDSSGDGKSQQNELSLIEYVKIISSRRKMIRNITGATMALSLIVSFILPEYYESSALIIPPQSSDQNMMSLVMGQLGGMANIASGLLGTSSNADMYVGILNSNKISDDIIDKFKLMQIYNTEYRLDTYKQLDKHVDISAGKKTGIITITVEDRDPKRSADIANEYVEELRKISAGLNMTNAGRNSNFLEGRIAKARIDLYQAEDRLKEFQAKHKAFDITEQAKGTIKGVSDLTAQLAIEEIKLNALRRTFTDSSQDVKNQRLVVDQIKSQIAHFESKSPSGSAVLSLGSVPELGQEYMHLMRNFKIQESLLELLTKQYEITKLGENNDVDSIEVIQPARVPDKKSKPKRVVVVALSTLIALFTSIVGAYLLEFIKRMPATEKDAWRTVFISNKH